MNGKVYLKGIPYFSDSQVVELTQAEYDALPSTKLSDDILYCINDSGISGQYGVMPVIYSNKEREIGVWTDGKPLYQKTVHINALPSTAYTAVSYPHNIANIDQICGYEAIARWSNGQIVQIPRLALYNGTTWSATANYCFGVDGITKTDIVLLSGSDRSALNADVTIQYTKTTDTAGGGTWNNDGTPMHHYTTSEKIIGTWVDGSTLYEKTIVHHARNNVAEANVIIDSSIKHNSNCYVVYIEGIVNYGQMNTTKGVPTDSNVYNMGTNKFYYGAPSTGTTSYNTPTVYAYNDGIHFMKYDTANANGCIVTVRYIKI